MLRKLVDVSYPLVKHLLFALSYKDPEKSHLILEKLTSQTVKLSHFLQLKQKVPPNFCLSLAAGFDKNATFSPDFYNWLGVNRVVIGTLTLEKNLGNKKPRALRLVKQQSMVNWLGLPNLGLSLAIENINNKSYHCPVTISLATSLSSNARGLKESDQLSTMLKMLDNCSQVDRVEFNLSCPNVEKSTMLLGSEKAYADYMSGLLESLQTANIRHREVFLKISPSTSTKKVKILLNLAKKFGVSGFTVSNSAQNRHFKDKNGKLVGGVSGELLYPLSYACLKRFSKNLDSNIKLIFCGGLSTPKRMLQKIRHGVKEFQLYTPLIYQGPAIITKLADTLSKVDN